MHPDIFYLYTSNKWETHIFFHSLIYVDIYSCNIRTCAIEHGVWILLKGNVDGLGQLQWGSICCAAFLFFVTLFWIVCCLSSAAIATLESMFNHHRTAVLSKIFLHVSVCLYRLWISPLLHRDQLMCMKTFVRFHLLHMSNLFKI